MLGPSSVSVRRRFRSLFAGLEHQSGSELWLLGWRCIGRCSVLVGIVWWRVSRWAASRIVAACAQDDGS
jgi:hypothetical protein